MLREWLAVALGGLAGTLLRHAMVNLFSLGWSFGAMLGTLAVNLLGCLAIGYLAQWSLDKSLENSWWVVGIRAGLLGGLTTFSSFGLDVVRLWQTARPDAAVGLASAHVFLGIGALIVGMQLARA